MYRRRRTKLCELLSTRLVDAISISRNMKNYKNTNTITTDEKMDEKYNDEVREKLHNENLSLMVYINEVYLYY